MSRYYATSAIVGAIWTLTAVIFGVTADSPWFARVFLSLALIQCLLVSRGLRDLKEACAADDQASDLAFRGRSHTYGSANPATFTVQATVRAPQSDV